MAKKSSNPYEPWFHKASGCWSKKVDGKVHYLSRDYRTAKRKLVRLLSERDGETSLNRDWLETRFVVLADEYLADVKARRAPATFRNYKEQICRALKILGTSILVGSLRRIHLAKIEQKMAGNYSPTTIRDTISTVQQVFNWAVRNDLLESSPLVGFVKPKGRGRNRIVTAEEFQALLRYSDRSFQRFLIAMKFTGCRPGELRHLTWEMVNLEDGLWIIQQHKTVTTQEDPRPRIIPLCPRVWKMCSWLRRVEQDMNEHVFTNQLGRPYTKDCVVRKMARLRERAGIRKKAGENLVLYSNRHTYATSAVGKVSDTELAELMGHTTTRMLRRYVHLNTSRLREIRQRIDQRRSQQDD